MELTREEAIKRHREMWKWLAENPMKKKADWPGWSKAGYAENHCFCCEYVKYFSTDGCKSCPVVWQDTPACVYENSFYRKWQQATAPEERSRLAALIRDLPKRVEPKTEKEELKPDFKIGDWVKVLNCGQSFNSYIDFFAENNLTEFADAYARRGTKNGEVYKVVGIGKHRNTPSYGFLYVLQSQEGKTYIMYNGKSGQQGNKSLELTEAPKSEKQPEKVPFEIGDRIRCIKIYMGNNATLNKTGTILGRDNNNYFAIDFDDNVNGHDGFAGVSEARGKHGHCWCMPLGYFELLHLPLNHCPEPKTITESGATFIFRDSVTVCIIGADGRKFKGIARCAPEVTWDETIGKGWAYIRAMRKILNAIEKNLKKA